MTSKRNKLKASGMAGFVAMALFLIVAGVACGDELTIKVPGGPVTVTRDAHGYAQFAGQSLQYLNRIGEPGLPSQVVKVLLPPDTDLAGVSVRLEGAIMEELEGEWDVGPMPPVTNPYTGPVWPEGRLFDGRGQDIATYGDNHRFPPSLVGRPTTGQTRQWRMADIPLALFQYNPVTGKLYRLVAAELKVAFSVLVQGETLMQAPSKRVVHDETIGQGTVERLTVNFKEVAPRYEIEATRGLAAPPVPVLQEESRYAIITTRAIASQSKELPNFMASKRSRGFSVRVVTEETWGGGTGDAAAENLRRWLIENYENLGIEYLLLIGNPDPFAGDVPMKRLWPRNPGLDLDSPSDYYYADLTGNWDLDGDGYYGEAPVEVSPGVMNPNDFGPGGVDLNWDVLVGRIPCYGNMADLDHILAKIITYENTPPSEAAWRKKILLPMNPSDPNTPGYQLGEEIKRDVIMPKSWGYHRVYEEDYGLMPPPETSPCTADTVTSAWNGDEFGAIFWWTHGWAQGAVDIMTNWHAETLRDQYPGFTFQASCDNAYPEFSNNLSYFLLRNGGIATVGATRWSWYWVGQGTDMFPIPFAGSPTNSGMAFEYAKRLITDEMDSGHALYELKQTFGPGFWMNFTGFNIYGDPSVGLFTTGEDIEVAVDIKPGSFPNSINPRSKGVIPVAILTTDTFDATTVDPLSVKFGPDGATEAHGRGHRADVNRDGKKDLVLHFRTQDTGIVCGDTSASLTGETFSGQAIEGSDSIRTVGCKSK